MNAEADRIGFAELVTQLARGYERRPAAEAAISHAARGPACVLVCGEPGSGKSALAAHFIQTNRWCCHFLRIGHTEFTLWRDPYAFLASLAFQLMAAFGDEIFPDSVVIDVNGTVKDVAKTGAVVGVDVDRLVAVPWRRERLKVDLNAKGIAGEVTGIRIGELVENYRSVPLTAFRELAWFEPLRRLRERKPGARVTLWVDGLDEDVSSAIASAEASGQRGLTSIASLLPLDSECRQMGNVCVVISSRRGAHLDRFVADGATMIELNAPSLAADTGATLMGVVDRELADPRTQAALAELKWPADDVRTALLGRSEGNFLFIRQYFEALRAGYGAALRDGGLPEGVDDIHTRILTALLRDVPAAQRPHVLGLLEVLAVAQEPLSAAQLARFIGVDEPATKLALSLLRPLLDETAGETPPRFSCYHKSLRDSLLDPRHDAALWHVDAATAHRRVAAAYFRPDGTSSRLDGYGVLHGATHLVQARPDGPDTLLRLLHDGWRRFCREVTGSNRVFRHGLELAREHAATLPAADACLRVMRLALTDVYLRSAEGAIPDALVEMMVRLGQVQRALEIAPEDTDPVRYARRNAAIIRGLLAEPAGDAALAARLLEQSARKLKLRPEWLEPEVVAVLEEWPLEKAAALREIFPALESAAMSSAKRDARALAAFARIRTVLEPRSANAWFQEAFDAAVRNGITDAGGVVARIFSAWAGFDAPAAREHLERRGSFPTTRSSAAGFMDLGNALEKAGAPGASVYHGQLLLNVSTDPGRDALETAGIWLQVLLKAPAICPPATAAQIVDRAQEVLAKARSARPADGKPAAVPAAEMALRVEMAEAERVCNRARNAEVLGETWQVLFEGAAIDETDLRRLVRLQAIEDSEVLEAYVDSAPEKLREELWLAVLREGVLPGKPGAAMALERAVIAAEKPRATGWSMFFYSLAEHCDLSQLERSEQYLRDVGVNPSIILRWRLTMLRRLAAENDPRAREWLVVTMRYWARSGTNWNFIDEFPAMLAELPDDVRAAAEPLVAELPSSKQRRLVRAALASATGERDQPAARAAFESLASEPLDPKDPVDVDDYVIDAFVAGQWWRLNTARAAEFWDGAVARLASVFAGDASSSQGHYVHRCAMLRALQWGAPDVAVRELLAMTAPPPEPGTRLWMMPFPSVSPFRVANLPEHELLLGNALARAAPRNRGLVLETIAQPLPARARAYALPEVARAATSVPLPQRMAWCQEAAAAAAQVEELPLRHLLLAASAAASVDIGARRRGLEIAGRVATAITPHLTHGDTVLAHTHAAALGSCVAAAIRCEAWTTAWDWLWQGRLLGMHGFYVALAELPGAMRTVCPLSFEQFEAAEGAGRNFYVNN